MDSLKSTKEKLVVAILNLARRSIDEARKVPYVIEQENVVDILINNPALYQQLVLDGEVGGKGIPQGKLIVKLDILSQMDEFHTLDGFDMSFSRPEGFDAGHDPLFAQVDLLTKLFMAYHSNMVTTFEREYDQFLERFRQSARSAKHELESVELDSRDLEAVQRMAEEQLRQGRYIEAFSLGKLFHPELLRDHFFRFPSSNFSITGDLLRSALEDEVAFSRLVKFVLRACYLSHNNWRDLFGLLVDLTEQEPELSHRSLLIDLIEGDFVFCCNLFHSTYDQLHCWTAAQRKEAISEHLKMEACQI